MCRGRGREREIERRQVLKYPNQVQNKNIIKLENLTKP